MEYDDMNPTQRVRRNRIYLTLVVAVSHLALLLLGIINRLGYSVPTRYPLLLQTLNSNLWLLFHGLCFLAVVVSLLRKKSYISSLAAATGVMGSWSFLSLLWGLTTPTPVSLSGPVLGGAITTLSYLLTMSWARAPKIKEGDD